jgi:hypothetical protein
MSACGEVEEESVAGDRLSQELATNDVQFAWLVVCRLIPEGIQG